MNRRQKGEVDERWGAVLAGFIGFCLAFAGIMGFISGRYRSRGTVLPLESAWPLLAFFIFIGILLVIASIFAYRKYS
ncbi:hypothetical protein [Planktothrix phage Pag-JY44]|nr:hypothetical protein [Aphanizomenon phage Yong-DA]